MVILLVLSITTSMIFEQQKKPKNPTTTVPKKETILVLPYLGVQSKIVTAAFELLGNNFTFTFNFSFLKELHQ